MQRKAIAVLISVLLLFPLGLVAAEPPDAPSETQRLERLKANAETLRLSGKKAAVIMADNSRTSGHIADVANDGFTLTTNNGERKQFSFADVRTIKKSGLSTGAKVGIGVGIGIGALVAVSCAIGICGNN